MSQINEAQVQMILGSTQLSLLWICAIVAAMVFVALVYSVVAFRPVDAASANTHRHTRREVVWALVPIFIVIAAALPAMRDAVPSDSNDGLVTENRQEPCSPLPTAGASVLATSVALPCSKHR